MATVDVIKDFPWCINTNDTELLKDCPKIHIQFHRMKDLGVVRKARNLIKQGVNTEAGKAFYDSLYDTEKEDTYTFPFFDTNYISYSNSFSDNLMGNVGNGQGLAAIGDKLSDIHSEFRFMGELGGVIAGAVRSKNLSALESLSDQSRTIYPETPQYQQFGKKASDITVTFTLLNTSSTKGYDKNIDLVRELARINKPTRKTSIFMEPSRICKIKIPGYRDLPWAYCSNFSLNGLGTQRMVGSGILPEAYQLQMVFTPLITEDSSLIK